MNLPPVHAVHRNLCTAIELSRIKAKCRAALLRFYRAAGKINLRKKKKKENVHNNMFFFYYKKKHIRNSSIPVFAKRLHLHFYCLIARQQTRRTHKQKRKFTPLRFGFFVFINEKRLERKWNRLSAEEVMSQLRVRFQRHLL